MFDQFLDGVRKASESSMQMQQELWKQWTQQWFSGGPGISVTPVEPARSQQKRWFDMTIEMLNRHRESLDAAYKAGIQILEQSFYLADAKSGDDYRRMMEDIWRKVVDHIKEQSESQMRDFHKWSERSAQMAQNGKA